MDLNRATILGRLTRDPEVRTTTSGKTVTQLGVATNRTWKDQAGVKQEVVEYHSIVLWGKLAEIAGQYLTKGRRLYVEGRIQTRDWAGTDGVKKYKTEIVGDNMIMLDGPRGSGTGNSAPTPGGDESSYSGGTNDGSDDEIKVEDIPF